MMKVWNATLATLELIVSLILSSSSVITSLKKFAKSYFLAFIASIDFESPYLLVHMSTVPAGNHSESRISFNSIS